MKKFFSILIVFIGCTLTAASQNRPMVFKSGDLFYYIPDVNVNEVKIAPNFPMFDDDNYQTADYEGAITVPYKVSYDNREYTVAGTSLSYLNSSKITELTFEEGFESLSGSLSKATSLEKLVVPKTLQKRPSSTYPTDGLNIGNSLKCLNVYVRTSGEATTFKIDKFNVYYNDGTQPKPFMLSVNTQSPEKLYPDENGEFHFANDDEMLKYGCIKLSSYYTFYLYYGDGDTGVSYVRAQPGIGYTGIFVEKDGIRYSVQDGYACVYTAAEGEVYSGNVVIPAAIEYNEEMLPVEEIVESAFERSDIISLELPESIKVLPRYMCAKCNKLESVLLSENLIECGANAFAFCAALECVNLPASLESISRDAFYNCTSLKDINIRSKLRLMASFSGCTQFYTVSDYIFTEDAISFKLESNFKLEDGRTVPFMVWTPSVQHYQERLPEQIFYAADGRFTIPKKYLYNYYGTPENSTERFYGMICIYADNRDGDYLPELAERPNYSIAEVKLLESEMSGIETPSTILSENSGEEYYNLQGIRCKSTTGMQPGLYIRRCGDKVSKVYVR